MPEMPYPSRLTIARVARAAGHVVHSEDQTMTVETLDTTIVFGPDGSIKTGNGTSCTIQEALDKLGLDLSTPPS